MTALACYVYMDHVGASDYIIYHHRFHTFPIDIRFIHSPDEITKVLHGLVEPEGPEENEI